MKNSNHTVGRARSFLHSSFCVLHSAPKNILLTLVKIYRWTLSPVLVAAFGAGAGCRFTPTCSVYAIEAVQQHGATAGGWLAAKRLCRCHPWGGCGHDPVPPAHFQNPVSHFNSLPHGS